MNCRCVPWNILYPSQPRDQCGSVRSFTIGADKTWWFLGAGDAGFREGSPTDVVNGGILLLLLLLLLLLFSPVLILSDCPFFPGAGGSSTVRSGACT